MAKVYRRDFGDLYITNDINPVKRSPEIRQEVIKSLVENMKPTLPPIPSEPEDIEETNQENQIEPEDLPSVDEESESPDTSREMNYGIQRRVDSEFLSKLKEVDRIDSSVVEAGLIDERHDLPCQLFVFPSALSGRMMFSYREQENRIRDFLYDNIPQKNGGFVKDLHVYVTGLQCVLAALIKVCSEEKVNLTLKHWNNLTGDYANQRIFTDFYDPVKFNPLLPFRRLLCDSELFFYDCTASDVTDEKFFIVKQTEYISRTTGNITSKDNVAATRYIVAKNMESMWAPYQKSVEEQMETDTPLSTLVYQVRIEGSLVRFNGGPMMRSYNFQYSSK